MTQNYRLMADADITHEDAEDMYSSYGWHLSTEDAGDVTLQAVEFDWLDQSDDSGVAAKLLDSTRGHGRSKMTVDEAEQIVAKAREVRESMESIDGLLEQAVAAHERGDVDSVIETLDNAQRQESEHGDCPESTSLRGKLLEMIAPE